MFMSRYTTFLEENKFDSYMENGFIQCMDKLLWRFDGLEVFQNAFLGSWNFH